MNNRSHRKSRRGLFISLPALSVFLRGIFSPKKNAERIRGFTAKYPAAATLLTCIPAAMTCREPFGMLFFYSFLIPLVLIAWKCLPAQTTLKTVLVPAFLILVSAKIASAGINRNILAETIGFERFCGNARVEICDDFASDRMEEDFRNQSLDARVLGVQISDSAKEIVFEKPPKVKLKLPDEMNFAAGYGDILRVQGEFAPVNAPLCEESFDYRAYLADDGIHEFLYADQISRISAGKGFLRALYHRRDQVLSSICKHVQEADCRAILVGMLIGRKTSMDAEMREDFLRSGTIHILTVSGTHVMIVAGLVLCLLKWLSLSWRCVFCIPVIFTYTLMAGLHGSAIRAFVMLSVCLIYRAMLLKSHPVNSLSAAAWLLLLYDPASVMKTGMYYSFLSVLILFTVLGSRQGKKEKNHTFMPDRKLSKSTEMKPWLVHAYGNVQRSMGKLLLSSAAVSAGTSALTLLYQGFLPLPGFWANFIILPAASAAFVMSGLTWVFQAVPVCASVCGRVLEMILGIIAAAGHAGAGLVQTGLPKPPVWSVLLFIGVFLLFPHLQNRRKIRAAGGILCGLLLWWHIRPGLLPPETVVISGGEGTEQFASVLYTNPAMGRADIVNISDRDTAYMMIDCLKSRGIDRCRIFASSSGQKRSFGGAAKFAQKYPVLTACVPSNAVSKLSPYAYHTAVYNRKDGEKLYRGFFEQTDSDGGFRFELDGICGELSLKHIRICSSKRPEMIYLDERLDFTNQKQMLIREIHP